MNIYINYITKFCKYFLLMQDDHFQQFRKTLAKIDNLCHIKEFKSLSETKINHLKKEKSFYPPDYYIQTQKILLHIIYLYYVAYVKKTDIFIYPNICINKWGVLFKYYSLNLQKNMFMKKIEYKNFQQNVKAQFIDIWKLNLKDQDQSQLEENQKNKKDLINPWTEFGEVLIECVQDHQKSPQNIMSMLQQMKLMKNNILILGILSSTLFPCIKLNSSVERAFNISHEDQFSIVKKMFNKQYEYQGTKDFINSIIRFFKILNNFKILGITTTLSDKSTPKIDEGQTLLTEFFISLGRPLIPKQAIAQSADLMQDSNKNQTSNKSSEHDYNEGNYGKDLGQLRCQYFWSRKFSQRQLSFRISIFLNKKIYPLYFNEIESIWYKLCQKWKVILNEDKQLSGFNPGFLILEYNRQSYQLSFTDYVKYQPMQHILAQLILATDKLIIASLLMKDVICFYERKSLSVEILEEQLVVNDGRLGDLALSVCQSIKNYYSYCKKVINKTNIN